MCYPTALSIVVVAFVASGVAAEARFGVKPYSLPASSETLGPHVNDTAIYFRVRPDPIDESVGILKQYFGYLCAPQKCVPKEVKLRIGSHCFRDQGDTALRELIADCLPPSVFCPSQEKEEVIKCVIEKFHEIEPEVVLDAIVVKCVDELLTVRMVKCIDPWMNIAGFTAAALEHRSRFSSMLVNKLKTFSEVTRAELKPLPAIPASMIRVEEKIKLKTPKNEIPIVRPRLYIPQNERGENEEVN